MSSIVHVIDDDEAVRGSVLFLLATAGLTARGYASAVAFLENTSGLAGSRGCIVTDMRMPGMDGLKLQEELGARGIDLPVVVMTGHGDVQIAVRAMKAGAVDFIEKPFEEGVLLSAIAHALDRDDVKRSSAIDAAAVAQLDRLTKREHDVFACLAQGQSNKAIARHLGISPRTVEVYRARVMDKLQVQNLADLVRLAIAAGAGDGA